MTGCRIARSPDPTPARFTPTRTALVQRCACGQTSHSGGACDECKRHDQDAGRAPARAGVTIGPADDAYEREADRVADRVLQMDPMLTRPASGGATVAPAIQRFTPTGAERDQDESVPIMTKGLDGASCDSGRGGAEEEEPEDKATARAKAEHGTLRQPEHSFARSLTSSRGGGNPLAPDTQAFMQARFGADFSAVRVHTDQRAAAMNEQLHAAAFTSGRDIYFRSSRYDPGSYAGNRLLAHELTHVVQQHGTTAAVQTSARIQPYVQRFTLNGFPAAEAAAMTAAVPLAVSKVKSCAKLSWYGKSEIPIALNRMRYDYVPDLGLCGWTFPASPYIEVGEQAFDRGRCCDLASTLAHEASHTAFYTEGRARTMECNCFGCSC